MGTWVSNPPTRFVSNLSGNLVSTRFDDVKRYAETAIDLTGQYVNTLSGMLTGLENGLPSISGIDIDNPYVPGLDITARPKFGDLNLPTGWPTNVPPSPVLYTMPDLEPVTMPSVSFSPPEWYDPPRPDINLPEALGTRPQIGTVSPPPAPTITLPDPPSLADVVLPPAPNITLPEFTATLPDEILNIPAGFSWQESPYNSPVWNDFLDKVIDGVRNGGTGLTPEVRDAIIWEAQEQQRLENDKKLRAIRKTYGTLGYRCPPGALAGAELELWGEINKGDTDLNKKVLVSDFELAQKNTQFLLELIAARVEPILREFHNAQMNRSLEGAKLIAQGALEIFNAYIARYNARIEGYKARAAVYESRIKASLTEVEIFKGQVEAAKVSSDVQKNLAEIYQIRVQAVETEIKLYTAQVEATRTLAEIERLKLELYKTETDAYIAGMQAEKIKVDLYATQVESERTKASAYAEKVRAYAEEVNAKKVEVELKLAELEATLKANQLLIEEYKGRLTGYTAQIQAMASRTGAVVEGFKAEVAGYAAETEAKGMEYGARIKAMDVSIAEAEFKLKRGVALVEAATTGYMKAKELQIEGTKGIMNVEAQLAAAAMSAVNATASLDTRTSASENHHYGHDESITETHRYEHE